MRFKDIRLSVGEREILRVTSYKAEKLYNRGYEVFLFPFNFSANPEFNNYHGVAKKDLRFYAAFDKMVNRFQYRYSGSRMGRYPVFFVDAAALDEFNSTKS